MGLRQAHIQALEVDAGQKHSDRRHHNVVDERTDDFTECAADNDTDGHVDNIAAHDKRFKIIPHSSSPFEVNEKGSFVLIVEYR